MPGRCKLKDDRWWLLKYSEGSRVKEIKVVLSEWLDKNNLNIKDIDLTDGRYKGKSKMPTTRLKPTFIKSQPQGNRWSMPKFRYLNGYWFRLIDASICWTAAEVDTQFAIFPCYAPKKQCPFFFLP